MTETSIVYKDHLGRERLYPQSFDLEQLEGIREFVGAATCTMADAKRGHKLPTIRHDVDHSLDYALRFARWEKAEGLVSSYYLLHTAWYWREPGFGAKVRELQGLGHEVGLHHDSLTAVARLTGLSADALTRDWFEMAYGVFWHAVEKLRGCGTDDVFGCAAHGSDMGFRNLDVWNHWDVDYFGLTYEAYHLNEGANYISDNRGRINSPLQHEPGRPTRLLIHPEHWQLPEWTAKKED